MTRKTEDPNEAAARVVSEATRAAENADALPTGVEAAWQGWIGRMQNVDARTLALLRAAFEAGYDAASVSEAARRTAS